MPPKLLIVYKSAWISGLWRWILFPFQKNLPAILALQGVLGFLVEFHFPSTNLWTILTLQGVEIYFHSAPILALQRVLDFIGFFLYSFYKSTTNFGSTRGSGLRNWILFLFYNSTNGFGSTKGFEVDFIFILQIYKQFWLYKGFLA